MRSSRQPSRKVAVARNRRPQQFLFGRRYFVVGARVLGSVAPFASMIGERGAELALGHRAPVAQYGAEELAPALERARVLGVDRV